MKEDFSDFLPRIKADINQRFPLISFFLLLMLVLRIGWKVPFSDVLFVSVCIMCLYTIPLSFIFEKSRRKGAKKVVDIYFYYLLFDFILLIIIIYLLGDILWITPAFWLFYVINLFWLFPQRQAFLLTLYGNVLLLSIIVLQYYQKIPSSIIFLPFEKNAQSPLYLFTTSLTAVIVMGFLAFLSNIFYQLLQEKIKKLKGTRKKLETRKKLLLTEVTKKTKDLRAEKVRLEETIKVRVRELEEKRRTNEERIKKLSFFHKKAVGRELEMAEIKEKITRLKELKLKQ